MRATTRLKQIMAARKAVTVPGAANAHFARVIEDLGFEVVYITGAGVANMHLGAPDVGLTTLTELASAAGLAIGFVRVGFSPDYAECPADSPVFGPAKANGLFRLGSPGVEIHPALGQKAGDWLITKHRVSPFYATDLEAYLRANRIERIFCSGVSTQAVVQATVRDGHDRDYAMVLLEDCCAAHAAEEHRNSIGSLGRFCRVTTSDQVDFAA